MSSMEHQVLPDSSRHHPDEDDPNQLASEIESRLREYLARASQEYPQGCQADWLAGVVANKILQPAASRNDEPGPMLNSLVKLCVFLMENLADVSNSYEEFYSQQMTALRDESASAHAQVAALDDENGRLREQLHRRAEELRMAQAAIDALKARNLAAAAAPPASDPRFDEAVAVDDAESDLGEEEKDEEVELSNKARCPQERGINGSNAEEVGECQRCAHFREAAERAEAEAARRLGEAAAASAALKVDIADWEADMAEKVHQNVELAAQLESCQRMLARLQQRGTNSSSSTPAVPAASRSIFGGMLVKKQ